MNKQKNRSIAGQVKQSTRLLTFVLLIPALISLVLMLVYAEVFSDAVTRMDRVAALQPLVNTQLPEQVWSAVAGRSSFEYCGARENLALINDTLDDLIEKSSEEGKLELIVARRTMDTLGDYVNQVGANIAGSRPVTESEKTLEEVRSVAKLVDEMLQDYIATEITLSSQTNVLMLRIVWLSAGIEGLLLILAVWISTRMRMRLSRNVHEPIHELEQVTGRLAKGDLRARAPQTNIDEMIPLTDGVNVMADQLEGLIAQNKQEQINLKKAELRTLQAQINPHFLYNTLDAIIWQAESGHTDEIIQLTKALSDFFRISLSSGRDWIPVAQEVRHLTGYLAIQKIRYRDILNYEIDIDDALMSGYILKLLLQPLVENALYHGIKYRRGGGCITVTGRADGELCHFSVADTGRGMTPEQLQSVRDSLMHGTQMPHMQEFPDHTGSGFGLRNVDQRIRLYYAKSEGLAIDSSPQGTCVSFSVPVRKEEGL
ncbi:MAG: sensor histidine kinase [Eubacteriales bacterium]|nr:sensor histidine kinase [Eubacteriales bacterium]